MENSIVIFLGSVALVMIIFNVVLYLGKKYSIEKDTSSNDLVEIEIEISPSIKKNLLKLESTTGMTRDLIITTALEEYLDSFKK